MILKEWIKKDEVMDIIKGLPQDLWEEYIYMLKGVWCDEEAHGLAEQAEPVKHGKWVLRDGYYCSSCGYKLQTTAILCFCPNCGAKMDK